MNICIISSSIADGHVALRLLYINIISTWICSPWRFHQESWKHNPTKRLGPMTFLLRLRNVIYPIKNRHANKITWKGLEGKEGREATHLMWAWTLRGGQSQCTWVWIRELQAPSCASCQPCRPPRWEVWRWEAWRPMKPTWWRWPWGTKGGCWGT